MTSLCSETICDLIWTLVISLFLCLCASMRWYVYIDLWVSAHTCVCVSVCETVFGTELYCVVCLPLLCCKQISTCSHWHRQAIALIIIVTIYLTSVLFSFAGWAVSQNVVPPYAWSWAFPLRNWRPNSSAQTVHVVVDITTSSLYLCSCYTWPSASLCAASTKSLTPTLWWFTLDMAKPAHSTIHYRYYIRNVCDIAHPRVNIRNFRAIIIGVLQGGVEWCISLQLTVWCGC